jgi:hypothetical protein
MLACFDYVVQLNEITPSQICVTYLVEVRIWMDEFCNELTHESNKFGQIALEQPR